MATPFLLGKAYKAKSYMSLSSLEWVRGIRDSEFVVTDSFHGIVFSIIFSKQFYYVVTSPTARDRISRIETLLSTLGITNRIVESPEECDFSDIIDYSEVSKRLKNEREKSLKILKETVS